MFQAQKAIRVHNLAMAFKTLANHPDKTLDVAVEVDDDVVTVIESNLHKIAAKLNGGPDGIGAEIEAWLNPVATPFAKPSRPIKARAATLAPAAAPVEDELPGFQWKAVQRAGAALGDLNAAFECQWQGLALKVVKKGPADYEGFIGDEYFARSKFKKNMRERLEKEAARRVTA